MTTRIITRTGDTGPVRDPYVDFGSGYHVGFKADDHFETSRGVVPGRYVFHRFAYNPAVSTTEEDIWNGGGNFAWPTSALPLRVRAGGNANDTAAGTGARTITIIGLDANFNEITENLTLAGGSASANTSQSFIRLTRAFVATCGTYTGSNTAAIIVENTGGVMMCNMAAGVGQTQLSMFTVPAGYTAWLHRVLVLPDSSKSTTVRMYRRNNADTVAAPFSPKRIVSVFPTTSQSESVDYQSIPSFPAKTDLWATAQTASGSGPVGVHYDLVMVAD